MRSRRIRAALVTAGLVATVAACGGDNGGLAALPSNQTRLATKLDGPTALAVAPDGRVFVASQGGAVTLVDSSGAHPDPVLTVDTKADDEEGLTAIAVDPDFASNGFLYVTYTVLGTDHHERVSRFTVQGDKAEPSSEKVLVDLGPNQQPFHLGGAIAFGTDGAMFVSTGENSGKDPQSLDDLAGKVLRFNADGTIPDDDPYASTAEGLTRAVWARGFRAPFTMAVDEGTGHLYVSDVGESRFEEVNDVLRDGNYGWPISEGPTTEQGQTSPVYSYGHDEGCAIVGGAIGPQGYTFMDYCKGKIKEFDPSTKQVVDLGRAASRGPVAIASAAGKLFYVTRGSTDLDGGAGPGYQTGSLFVLDPSVSPTPTTTSG